MDKTKARALLKKEWVSKLYELEELCKILGLTPQEALAVVRSINGGGEKGQWYLVTHGDLCSFLKDRFSIAVIPGWDDLSPQGKWLVENGWVLDGSGIIYRWVDPRERFLRLSLKDAVRVQLLRDFSLEEDAIEVEYRVEAK